MIQLGFLHLGKLQVSTFSAQSISLALGNHFCDHGKSIARQIYIIILTPSTTSEGKWVRLWAPESSMTTTKPTGLLRLRPWKHNSLILLGGIFNCVCVCLYVDTHVSIGICQGKLLDLPELESVTIIGAGNWILVPCKWLLTPEPSLYSPPQPHLLSSPCQLSCPQRLALGN